MPNTHKRGFRLHSVGALYFAKRLAGWNFQPHFGPPRLQAPPSPQRASPSRFCPSAPEQKQLPLPLIRTHHHESAMVPPHSSPHLPRQRRFHTIGHDTQLKRQVFIKPNYLGVNLHCPNLSTVSNLAQFLRF
jgi:hypothetical protein